MRLLLALLAAFWPPEVYASRRPGRAAGRQQEPDRRAPRGAVLSHRDWLAADVARSRLQAQWREVFRQWDVVLCPVMPTPAYAHDHSPDQEVRRIRIDGKDHAYADQLAWPGIATLPGLPATAIPLGLRPVRTCRSAYRSSVPGWKIARR